MTNEQEKYRNERLVKKRGRPKKELEVPARTSSPTTMFDYMRNCVWRIEHAKGDKEDIADSIKHLENYILQIKKMNNL